MHSCEFVKFVVYPSCQSCGVAANQQLTTINDQQPERALFVCLKKVKIFSFVLHGVCEVFSGFEGCWGDCGGGKCGVAFGIMGAPYDSVMQTF